ncbi:P-loop containing nucleoside triphosphate hydrolase protein, partial [Gorgonomyces haynaldii]
MSFIYHPLYENTQRQHASFLQKLLFSYVNPVLKLGKSQQLHLDDYPHIELQDEASDLHDRFNHCWDQELSSGEPQVWKAVLNVFWKPLLTANLLYFFQYLCSISKGIVLGLLLDWFAQAGEIQLGQRYTLLLCGLIVFESICTHQSLFLFARTRNQIQACLTLSIYSKCLGRVKRDSGIVTNLISNDVLKISEAYEMASQLLFGPLFAIALSFLIYQQISYAFIAPLVCLAFLILFQFYLGRLYRLARVQISEERDERIKVTDDVIKGMSVVKMYAWETAFLSLIGDIRARELKGLWRSNWVKGINDALYLTSALMLQTSAFLTFWFLGGSLVPSRIYSAISFMGSLQFIVTFKFSAGIRAVYEAKVSLQRLLLFLKAPEPHQLNAAPSYQIDLRKHAFEVRNADFAWSESVLQNVTLDVLKASRVCVLGKTGSGKSSFLLSLLGETRLVQGSLHRHSSISYCSQVPWITRGTIRENIVGASAYDSRRFQEIIRVCGLEMDLNLMPLKEDTVIVDRGLTLSGGQRSRVSLARCLYKQADVYLLDDPFAALDPTVTGQVLSSIFYFLKEKTIVVATQQDHLSKYFDLLVEIQNKTVITRPIQRQEWSITQLQDQIVSETTPSYAIEQQHDLGQEQVSNGAVSISTYSKMVENGSGWQRTLVLFGLMIVGEILTCWTGIWIAKWTETDSSDQKSSYYPLVLLLLYLGSATFGLIRPIGFYYLFLQFSKSCHIDMLTSILSSPMQFFHFNPVGRIINRFSADMKFVDELLPATLFQLISDSLLMSSTMILSTMILPVIGILFPLMLWMLVTLQTHFLATQRQVKREEAVTRSSVYSFIPITVDGITNIRSFSMEKKYLYEFSVQLNSNSRTQLLFVTLMRWLGIRLDLIGLALIGFASTIAIHFGASLGLEAGYFGLLLSTFFSVYDLLQWIMRESAEVETLMVSTERLLEYSDLEGEQFGGDPIQKQWPQGQITFKQVSMCYLDIKTGKQKQVLDKVSFVLPPGKKLAIVGRTGSGKSSLLQALFRLMPLSHGSILIDNVDTKNLQLSKFRSKMTIIPQEPLVFASTLRFNVDPLRQWSDQEIWDALTTCGLHSSLSLGLDTLMDSFSLGQRQLICLARALLHKTSILIMDEATSALDKETTQTLNRVISTAFGSSTIITIAHRLDTILSYDYVLVLDQGRLVEFGELKDLIVQNGYFGKLYKD